RLPAHSMKTLLWLCSSVPLSATAFTPTESHCTALLTELKKQPTPIFSLSSAKITTFKCGGDPETSPVLDRYRVYRGSGKIEWLERVEDNWRPYNPSQIK